MSMHICHISVLNPSLHPRIFYKLARSQRKLGYTVSIVAQDAAPQTYKKEDINIYPLKPFHRLSLKRFFFSWIFFRKIWAIPAEIYVIHSPELLLLGLLLKKIKRAKLVYDVHEDYGRTLREAAHYPKRLRMVLATCVRGWEKWVAKQLDAVAYAEEVYDNILEVAPDRKFFLRNKFLPDAPSNFSQLTIPFRKYMLYSGTLAEDWGIFRSLDLWENWNKIAPLNFIMAGVTPRQEILDQIQQRVAKSGLEEKFCLIGGATYVPYSDILALIQHCQFGTALYAIKPYIQGKMPTKFYEYMAFDKALLYTSEASWNAFNAAEQLGFGWKEGIDLISLQKQLEEWQKNPPQHKKEAYSWEGEEKELQEMMKLMTP